MKSEMESETKGNEMKKVIQICKENRNLYAFTEAGDIYAMDTALDIPVWVAVPGIPDAVGTPPKAVIDEEDEEERPVPKKSNWHARQETGKKDKKARR